MNRITDNLLTMSNAKERYSGVKDEKKSLDMSLVTL